MDFFTRIYYVAVALLISLIFLEELTVHYRVYLCPQQTSWFQILQQARFIFLFFLCWFMMLFALILEQSLIEKIQEFLKGVLKLIEDNIADWRADVIVVIGVLLVFSARYLFSRELIKEVIFKWIRATANALSTVIYVLALMAVVTGFYYVLALILNLIRNSHVNIQAAYNEWLWGSIVMLIFVLFFLVVNMHIFRKNQSISEENYYNIWLGLTKDYVIYFIIVIFLINGLAKWIRCAGVIDHGSRWLFFLGVCALSVVCALLALVMDHQFANQLERGIVGKSLENWQRIIMKNHINYRDWGLLVPLCVLVLIYTLSRLVKLE